MDNTLLDSHIFLWLLQEPEKLGPEAHHIIKSSTVYISLASIWELSIKYQKGKLKFNPQELLRAIRVMGATLLPIAEDHIVTTLEIDIDHGDPFDRILLAQAKSERFGLLTADSVLLQAKPSFVIDARQ